MFYSNDSTLSVSTWSDKHISHRCLLVSLFLQVNKTKWFLSLLIFFFFFFVEENILKKKPHWRTPWYSPNKISRPLLSFWTVSLQDKIRVCRFPRQDPKTLLTHRVPICVCGTVDSKPGGFHGSSLIKNLPAKQNPWNLWVEKIPWRRKWHATPVFLPGKPLGWRSLAGYSSWITNSQIWLSY